MLPNNFDGFSERFPELGPTVGELKAWIAANPHLDHIDIRRVLSERPSADPVKMAVAFALLEEAGLYRGKYGLIAPTNHVLADEFYDTLEDIPAESYDTTDRSFDTDDAEVVRLLVGAGR